MLLNQADTRSQGKLWEWREPRSASMYLSPRRRCHSLTFDAARHRTTHAADRHTAVYLWLAIAKVVSRLDDWSCLMQPRRAVHAHTYSGIKQLQSLERPQEWRDVTCDKWTVGIGFHTRTFRHRTPGVCVSLHQCFPRSAVRQSAAYQIVVGGQTALQTVVCPVFGTITKKSIGPIPIPPNTGKYWPIPNTTIPVSFEP